MLTNHKIFITAPPPLTTSTTSTGETVCTQQPHLRPSCCLHAVSSSYVIVVCGPLTPWLRTAIQTRTTLGTIISRAPLNPADLSSSTSSSMHIPPLSRSGPGSTHGSACALGGKPGRGHAYGKKHHHGNHPHSHSHPHHARCDGHLGGPQSQP